MQIHFRYSDDPKSRLWAIPYVNSKRFIGPYGTMKAKIEKLFKILAYCGQGIL